VVAARSLVLTSCFDTKHPLSDPQKSKPDERLTGLWWFRGDNGEMNYYHIGHTGATIPWMDSDAKKRAVEAGKIKGVIEKDQGHFTDTSENLAKFVAEAGDTLFSKDVLRLERVK
jgi:hypothetical protein